MPAQTPPERRVRAEPLDPAAFANLREFLGCEDLREVGEFLDEVLPDVDALVDTTVTAAADRDWRALKIAAHTLKSNCAMIGAAETSQLALAIETCAGAPTGPAQTVLDLTAGLAPAYARYRHALNTARASWVCS